MQPESFVPAVLALKGTSVDMVIEKLHAMFSTISQMNSNEVVAAYQTVTFVMSQRNLHSDPGVQAIVKALEDHMIGLASGIRGGTGCKARFEAVTGKPSLFSKILF